MKKNAPFSFAGFEIQPGERRTVNLPMSRLYSHDEITLPVQVINGRSAGPVLFVSAAVHGDEINGVEVIRRLLGGKALSGLRGTLLALPVANPFGFILHARYLPDRRDLNRSFPGSAKGSQAARLAHLIFNDIAVRCDYAIDLHTGSNFRSNLPQIRISMDDPETLELAKIFGAPVVVPSELREGSLREAIAGMGKPVMVYEAGEALYFNEQAIRTGLRGVVNIMRHVGMLPTNRSRQKLREPVVTDQTSWVRAGMSGIFSRRAQLGDMVKKGAVLGLLSDPLGDDYDELIAPFSGIVIGQQNLPLAHEGDALIHLAKVPDHDEAEEVLEAFQSSLTEEDFSLER